MLLKGAVNWNLERFASAEGGKLKYSVKINPQSKTGINNKLRPVLMVMMGSNPC